MDEWKTLPFYEAVWINPPVAAVRGHIYPFVDMASLTPGHRDVTAGVTRTYSGGGALFESGDTLMARITPCLENGKIARFSGIESNCIAHGSTEFIVVRGRPGITLSDFAYYLTSSDGVRHYAIAHMTGSSGRQRVPVDALHYLNVSVPPLSEQQAIAEVLGALDDKIEANRRMCVALEGFASALYERTYSQSAAGDSIRLSDRVEILTGGTPSTSTPAYWNGSIPWVSVVDLSPGPWVTATERAITPEGLSNSAARILPARTVVVSARGTVGRVGLTCGSMAINQSCYGLRDVNGYQLYLFHLVRTLVPMLQAGAHGSVFDTITRRSLESVSVRQIADEDVAGFEREVTPIYDLMLARARESESLRRLRDALLPKLLSGQVRVRLSKARVNETDRET